MLASLGRTVRGSTPLLVQCAGLASVAGGLWMVYEPLAFIVAGLGLVVVGAGLTPDPPRSE